MRASATRYAVSGRTLIDGVDFELRAGELHALLGPNGAGKSTLLKLLAGELRPQAGLVELNARPLQKWTPLETARQRAVLPQTESLRFGFTAEQVVALGRLACLRHAPRREAEIIDSALQATGVSHLRERRYPTLSAGERARVQLARVLSQVWEPQMPGTRFLLLDEPTANLDLAHQHDCMATARAFAAAGAGVLVVLHDPNLALLYADRASLMQRGRILVSGPPRATLRPEIVEEVFGIRVREVETGTAARTMLAVEPKLDANTGFSVETPPPLGYTARPREGL